MNPQEGVISSVDNHDRQSNGSQILGKDDEVMEVVEDQGHPQQGCGKVDAKNDSCQVLSLPNQQKENTEAPLKPQQQQPLPCSKFNSADIPDDAFLLTAPSFIAPYLVEQKGEKAFKDLTDEDKIFKLRKPAVALENYFGSPVGKLLTNIGLNLVQEFVQNDLLKMQREHGEKEKMMSKTGMMTHRTQRSILSLEGNIEESKKKNKLFKAKLKKCELCNFKTESELVMSAHKETPHMKNSTHSMIPHYHQCPNCEYEDISKAKLTRHLVGCLKRFNPANNLAPPQRWDTPAKLAKAATITVSQNGITTSFHNSSRQQQDKITGNVLILPKPNPGQHSAPLPHAVSNKITPIPMFFWSNNPRGIIIPGTLQGVMRGGKLHKIETQMLQQLASGQLRGIRHSANSGFLTKLGLQSEQDSPSMSGLKRSNAGTSGEVKIAPLHQQSSTGSAEPVLPSQPGQIQQGEKGPEVICEICDEYLADLDQLKTHMELIHKEKIQKIRNKPPLACQKCQFRFFTDQGLERHLLCSHGLITNFLQDAANKRQDSGRCLLCGKDYAWNLVAHVQKDHNFTLKPTLLSYKCVMCTATFGTYKLFSNHVYLHFPSTGYGESTINPQPMSEILGKRNLESSASDSNEDDTGLTKRIRQN